MKVSAVKLGGALARLVLTALAAAAARPAGGEEWEQLEPGLELGGFADPGLPEAGKGAVRVLRIDPARFEFRLLNASEPGQGRSQTARDWCENNGLVGAINASMYQTDQRSSVSLMKKPGHVNNPRLSRDKAVLVFDPLEPRLPPVKIIDRECDPFDAERQKYGTLVQSIRMLSCTGQNVWSPQPRRWSTAAIGTDRKGRVLFIHSRPPYATHDWIQLLTRLPLELARLMYVEGGPEAQLYVRSAERRHEFVGSTESGINEYDANDSARPVPNVVGIARRVSP